MKRTLYILCCSFFFLPAFSQQSTRIFADTTGNDTLKKAVIILIDQLKHAGSGNFVVSPSAEYSNQGIYLGNSIDKRQPVKSSVKLEVSGVEAFSIKADGKTVRIIGNSNQAVRHAVFEYLNHLGFRFYFANPDWHIIPKMPGLFNKWDIVSKPSYDYRRIWYGYGTGSAKADADYNFWIIANKLGGSINASFGHNYENIMLSNRDVFLKHPEWFYPVAEKGDLPWGAKFDMTRKDLIDFLIQYTEKEIQKSLQDKTQAYKMISMGPSDGLGTCNSPACRQLGTITDRVFYLVNSVAKGIQKKYPFSLIGCLAYGEYSSPPTHKTEPNVFVAITTAFNSSKYTVEQLVEEWKKKTSHIGIYDYFSWYAWDYDIPGLSQASKPKLILNSIKKYYSKGVRAYEGESSIGWISKGLGYYLAARQMWDVNADPEPARKEFFTLCFKKASPAMQKLWNEWENYTYSMVREKDLAKWIDYVYEADAAEPDLAVKKRLFQVKSYLHFLFLYWRYKLKPDEDNLITLLYYGDRKLDDGSCAGFPAFFELGNRSAFPGMAMGEKARWKSNGKPVTEQEMNLSIKEDRSLLKVPEPVKEFKYASKFSKIPNINRYQKLINDTAYTDNGYWFTNEWVIEIKAGGKQNYLLFTGDYIGDTTNIKSFRISVFPFTTDGNVSGKKAIAEFTYNKRRVQEKISLAGLAPGYYTMVIVDPVKIFRIAFSPAINYSLVMRPDRPIKNTVLNYAFFYVPEQVKRFNILKKGTIELITPTGRKISMPDKKEEEKQVQVLSGEAGLWRFKPLADELFMEGIPPYIGTSPKQMLIPAGIR